MTKLCKRLGVGLAAAALLLGLAGLHGAGQADAQTVPDGVFTGAVTIDGDAAPNGTVVTAMLEGEACATDTVGGAEGDGNYVLRIPASCEGMLSFMVGDMMAAETAEWSNSGLNAVDLSAMAAAMPTETPEEPGAMETETPDEPEEPGDDGEGMATETAMPTDDDTSMPSEEPVPDAPVTGTGLASTSASATTTLAAALGALALAVTLGGVALARRRG